MDEGLMKRVLSILAEVGNKREIRKEDSLMDDLELESIEIFVALGQLEQEFGIVIPERALREVDTVEDMALIVQELVEKA